jgi:hypothetical protein
VERTADAGTTDTNLNGMRAVQVTRFGGPEVIDVVDLPGPVPGHGETLFDISSAGRQPADTPHWQSCGLYRDQSAELRGSRSYFCSTSRDALLPYLATVAGLSPVPGFQTAAAACAISYVATLLSLLISHRGPKTGINEKREVGSVTGVEGSRCVVALMNVLAAVTASITAAAVLG